MAPFPVDILQPQPHIEARQDVTSPYEVTLTIARATTTYTTTMNLGGATPAPSDTAASTTGSAPTPSPSEIMIPVPSSGSDNRGAVIGGILGAFLGFMLLIVLWWKCFRDKRLRGRYSYYSDSDSSTSSGSTRIRRRGGGGGDDFSRHNRHGDRVRRPRSAKIRRHRKDRSLSLSVDGRRRSEGSWSRREKYERRGSLGGGLVYKNGVMGWPLSFSVKPKYVERTDRRYSRGGPGLFNIDD
jgi:hypothetical protein